MAEIALVSSRRARLESQANKGDKRAKAALQLSLHPDTFLSTVQIGITLIGILTGYLAGDKLETRLKNWLFSSGLPLQYTEPVATVIIVFLITYFSLVLGELVPKKLGLAKPELIAKSAAGPMRFISTITYPFVWLLTTSSSLIIKLFGISPKDNQVTEEEIKAIINEGTEHGAIEEAEQEIIERVFHLGDRNITSLMTHRSDIIWFDLNDNEQSIKEKIIQEPHSVYPICDGQIDNIKGMVSIKDLYVSDDLALFRDIMKPPMFVPENNSAYQVIEKFKESQLHSCFIVDEYGSLLGLITLNDILEAIVGDIPQTDTEDYEILEREDGSFLVDAQIPFYDFLTHFEKTEWMNEGEQEFNTIAGFILHQLQKIPKIGDKLEWKGFEFEVIDMDAQRIDKVLVTLTDALKPAVEDEE